MGLRGPRVVGGLCPQVWQVGLFCGVCSPQLLQMRWVAMRLVRAVWCGGVGGCASTCEGWAGCIRVRATNRLFLFCFPPFVDHRHDVRVAEHCCGFECCLFGEPLLVAVCGLDGVDPCWWVRHGVGVGDACAWCVVVVAWGVFVAVDGVGDGGGVVPGVVGVAAGGAFDVCGVAVGGGVGGVEGVVGVWVDEFWVSGLDEEAVGLCFELPHCVCRHFTHSQCIGGVSFRLRLLRCHPIRLG